VVSFKPACRLCVEGVVYWSVPTSIPQNLILDFQKRYTSYRSEKNLKLPKIEESEGRQHKNIQERSKNEYTRRLRMILKFKLNVKNKITTIGALAVPILRYNFGIVNWRLEEIRNIDRETRKIVTIHKMQ
jgi:hypothetical protein